MDELAIRVEDVSKVYRLYNRPSERLFDALRELDEVGAKRVYAHSPKTTGVGMAVYNRLVRAAGFDIIELD